MLRVLHPQVRLPADSKSVPQAIQFRTLILIGERLARRLAWFLSSMSFTTEGGNLLTLLELYCFACSIMVTSPRFKRLLFMFKFDGFSISHIFLKMSNFY